MGSCTVINSSKMSVHVLQSTPCVQINNSNGIDVYLSKDSESTTEVLTSGTMEISIHGPPNEANGDTVRLFAALHQHRLNKDALLLIRSSSMLRSSTRTRLCAVASSQRPCSTAASRPPARFLHPPP